MKRIFTTAIVASMIHVLHACSTPDTANKISNFNSEKAIAKAAEDSFLLSAGEYVVQISKPETCTPSEYSVKKELIYPDSNENLTPTLKLDLEKRMGDNWIRPAVCRVGEKHGMTVINLLKPTKIETSSSGISIKSVEKVTTLQVSTAVETIRLEPEKAYIVDISMDGRCANLNVTLNGRYIYAAALGSAGDDEKIFTSFSQVTDNLFHTLVCLGEAQYTASEYVAVGKNHMILVYEGGSEKFRSMTAREIVSRERVALNHGQ